MPVLSEAPRLAPLYLKALTGLTKRGGELPSRLYERVGVQVDASHLAEYNRVCAFRLTDQLPVTYPHVLTFPLQVKLMTDADFPYPLIGTVHVANRITQHRPLHMAEQLDLRVHVENRRKHPKGEQFDMIAQALVNREVVWHSTSTYLRRGPHTSAPGQTREELPHPTSHWHAPANTGRHYARVSGDRNPIHLHPLTARPFGFPQAIAHGMWTKARCLAALEGRLPHAFEVDVRFKLPVLLPAKLGFHTNGTHFHLLTPHGKPHLSGIITPL
ncbi:MaoC/PaaZ C-terminal domain-containing protein [Actinokineospora diospyrosa]|uniref:MaoC like domain-containing protein n=1 Tax=Actinokineospora diospyrosa TaxID=103728 RepID=A0ABT1ICE3_9PSEU|nr:MaoC/PaaZ C-terminal domain-containing protein [Actinokineospora diospyrosa]MCP2270310.1 MaoC like domain-containing protein [Actinokineospora diospyrosa]